jgi:hypothetical protein
VDQRQEVFSRGQESISWIHFGRNLLTEHLKGQIWLYINRFFGFLSPLIKSKIWSIGFRFVSRVWMRIYLIEILVLERVCLSCSCKHFGRKKTLVKSLLDLDKVIYYIGTFLQGSTKPLFTIQNRVEISWKKIARFFLTCVFKI